MPFRFGMCVWYENGFRKTLKLKPLISDINNIRYSTFMNTVTNGHKYPDLEFLEGYKDSIKITPIFQRVGLNKVLIAIELLAIAYAIYTSNQ